GRCSVTRIFVLLACLGESTAVLCAFFVYISCFFFNGPAPTAIYSLSLHDALPIYLPVEFTETRFPLLVEALGLAPDSGGPGKRRGGLGYRKEIRVLQDCMFLSVADRSILSCWGLKGGRAGRPFRVTVDPGGISERHLEGLVDDETLPIGTLVRIDTTG